MGSCGFPERCEVNALNQNEDKLNTLLIFLFGTVALLSFFMILTVLICFYSSQYTSNSFVQDWGSIIGGLGGAIIAIFGVWLTLRNNQQITEMQLKNNEKNIKENQRLDVLPIITLNRALRLEITDLISIYKDTTLLHFAPTYFTRAEITRFDFLIEGMHASPLDQVDYNSLESRLTEVINENNFISHFFKITNSGKSVALNLRIMLERQDAVLPTRPSYFANDMQPNTSYDLSFIINKPETCTSIYFLIIQYSDIYQHHYEQRQPLSMEFDEFIIGQETEQSRIPFLRY